MRGLHRKFGFENKAFAVCWAAPPRGWGEEDQAFSRRSALARQKQPERADVADALRARAAQLNKDDTSRARENDRGVFGKAVPLS